MHSQFALAAHRRFAWSCFSSGGIHVAMLGSVWIGVQYGLLPSPYATRNQMNSLAFVASAAAQPMEAIQEDIRWEDRFVTITHLQIPSPPDEIREPQEILDTLDDSLFEPIPRAEPISSRVSKFDTELTIDRPRQTASTPRTNPKFTPNLMITAQMSESSQTSIASVGADFEVAPTLSYNPAPTYPAEALAQQREGRVVLRVSVDREGRVTELNVWHSSGFSPFDQSALAAVRNWRFTPAQKNGSSISAKISVPVLFQIKRE